MWRQLRRGQASTHARSRSEYGAAQGGGKRRRKATQAAGGVEGESAAAASLLSLWAGGSRMRGSGGSAVWTTSNEGQVYRAEELEERRWGLAGVLRGGEYRTSCIGRRCTQLPVHSDCSTLSLQRAMAIGSRSNTLSSASGGGLNGQVTDGGEGRLGSGRRRRVVRRRRRSRRQWTRRARWRRRRPPRRCFARRRWRRRRRDPRQGGVTARGRWVDWTTTPPGELPG
jgi:hypothetical protein